MLLAEALKGVEIGSLISLTYYDNIEELVHYGSYDITWDTVGLKNNEILIFLEIKNKISYFLYKNRILFLHNSLEENKLKIKIYETL